MLACNRYHSYNTQGLAPGCEFCVTDEKLVLFITGICPRRCYFCPLSDEKYGKDVVFANERSVKETADIIAEAEAMDAKGAGITGGDPLIKLDRTIAAIVALKQRFGKQFHIHLYTSLNLVTAATLEKLSAAGLDEIRFHPDLDSKKFWQHLELVSHFQGNKGIEIPLIPTKEAEMKELFDFIHDKVDFLNLNELELADNSLSKLGQMGFVAKHNLSSAVKGSVSMGLRMMEVLSFD
ncbi:radical SAM protein [Candidatus Woesearchaeota archaeon]|nr:radical SAM protein [Candidatus Woesearchaeota archaeon]